MINISELINDPDFCQPNGIKVIRRKTTIENHRNVISEEELNFTGIITINSGKSTEFLPEANRNDESINVFTWKRLFVPTSNVESDTISGEGYLSDIVVWDGCKYEVISCMNDEQYGFCKSVAVRMSQR